MNKYIVTSMLAIHKINRYESDENVCYINRTATTKCCGDFSMSSHNKKSRVTKKKKKKKRVGRRVHFSPVVFIKKTISIYDMTDTEITATWLQENEEYEIRKECQTLIAQFDQRHQRLKEENMYTDGIQVMSQHIDDILLEGDVTMRGLESHTKQGREWKEMNRNESKRLILDKQYQQQHRNEDRVEEIASVSTSVSTICQIGAQLMAIQDRRDVEGYLG